MITETNLAYIAGMLDGEGCISINKRKDKEYKRGHSFYANLRITNTYLPVLLWIQDQFGGLGSIVEQPRKENRKRCWQWKVATNQAAAVCKMLLPYLRIKKRQAEILVEFQKLKETSPQCGRAGVPAGRWVLQEGLRNELLQLNARGQAAGFTTDIPKQLDMEPRDRGILDNP